MNKIICQDCRKTIYRYPPAKFCFDCIEKHEREGARFKYIKDRKGLGEKCIFCQKQFEQLHHSDLNTENNTLKNLIPLCLKCHKKIHYLIIKPILKKVGRTETAETKK